MYTIHRAYGSDITAPNVSVLSYYGAAYADITQPDDSEFEVYFGGIGAGNHTTIYCLWHRDCVVTCAVDESITKEP